MKDKIETKNHEKRTKWVLSKCLMIIKAMKRGKIFHKKSQNLIYYNLSKTVMSL